ncbi:MAG: YolD-like family protein [Eubacteriales bacterium]|nr:YolD-like family protein [Eubacteriales bacterium]
MENRPKMSRGERAKQFMPFAALKGYQEALRQRERVVVPRMELSEEYREGLDRKLRQVRKNEIVTVVYFCKNEYLKRTGMVAGIDETARVLRVVNTKIAFEDIYDISGEGILEE